MKKIQSILMLPLGAVYGIIGLVRRGLYKTGWFHSYRSTLPTICIGNLAVGGTGKTPMVEYLIRLFQTDRRVATLSRGYRRKTKGYLNSDNADVEVTAATFGDEPTQLHHKFPDVQVVVCEDRAKGLRRLERVVVPPDIVLLDDAYQHLSVRCDLNLLLTDYARPYYNDFPMPAGRLREFPSAAANADMVIVTKCPQSLTKEEAESIRQKLKLRDTQRCFFTTLAYGEPVAATVAAQNHLLTSSTPLILLTGIANPKPLYDEVRNHFADIELIEYGDHHSFTAGEINSLCKKVAEKGSSAVVFTTEKDLVRLQIPELKALTDRLPIFVVPVRVEFLFGEEDRFNRMVKEV